MALTAKQINQNRCLYSTLCLSHGFPWRHGEGDVMFLQNLLLIIMLIGHIRNRCIQSGRRDRESSTLHYHTQPCNSGWLDPTPVIYFLSPGLSLCKMQMTLNFFLNLWGQSKPVSHPCGPNFCYCCSIHELDVLDPTSLSFWNSSLCKLCFPRLWSVFYIQKE